MKIGRVEKLIPNLYNIEKYVLHYRDLQLYLKLGMKLTKIHRALEFSQSNCWKSTSLLIQRSEQKLKMLLKKTFSS